MISRDLIYRKVRAIGDPLEGRGLNSAPIRVVDWSEYPRRLAEELKARETRIKTFFSTQTDGVSLSKDRDHRDHNDALARKILEAKPLLAGSCCHWRYLLGAPNVEDRSDNTEFVYPLRYVGLIPPNHIPLQGVVIYVKGFNMAFEFDRLATETLLQNGFAVFTFDPLDHGLSAAFNPRTLRTDVPERPLNQYLSSVHMLQFIQEVKKVMETEPALRGLNLYFAGLSQGCLHGLLALTELGPTHGFAKIFLDEPTFELGVGRWRGVYMTEYHKLMPLLEEPNPAQKLANIQQYYQPVVNQGWIKDPRFSPEQSRYYEAYCEAGLGSIHWSLQYAFQNLFHRWARYTLSERQIGTILPSTMVSVGTGRNALAVNSPLSVYDFLVAFGNEETLLCKAEEHVNLPFQPSLIQRMISFFRGDLGEDPEVLKGTEAIRADRLASDHSRKHPLQGNWEESFRKGIHDREHG